MKKKTLVAVALGILIAALICIIVGLIIYLTALHTEIISGTENYVQLNAARSGKIILGLAMLIVGLSCFSLPAVVLLILLISFAVSAIKNRKKD